MEIMMTGQHSQRNPPMVRMNLVPAPDDSTAPPSVEEIQSALEQAVGQPPEASTTRMVQQFANGALNGRKVVGTPRELGGCLQPA
jgi:hypothetical protein